MYYGAMREFACLIGFSLLLGVPAAASEVEKPAATVSPVQTLSPAEMRADALDRMFALLHTATEDDAQRIEQNIWKAWMTSDSPSAELILGQASKAIAAKEYVPAIDMLTTLVELYPDYAEAWNKRATIFFIIGRDKESLDDIEKVLALEPRHFGALSGRGMIYEREGQLKEALAAFKEALAVNPHMPAIIEAVKRIEGDARAI